ncbi:hypothetical protein [Streptomyces sp. NPDC058463]|uniref:hypothetical protein n=1 Tax=Streptomyces sp. NPDC058463 TaxID=3346510 RepID=UPI0036673AD0
MDLERGGSVLAGEGDPIGTAQRQAHPSMRLFKKVPRAGADSLQVVDDQAEPLGAAGYDVPRLAFLLKDLPVQVLGRQPRPVRRRSPRRRTSFSCLGLPDLAAVIKPVK